MHDNSCCLTRNNSSFADSSLTGSVRNIAVCVKRTDKKKKAKNGYYLHIILCTNSFNHQENLLFLFFVIKIVCYLTLKLLFIN